MNALRISGANWPVRHTVNTTTKAIGYDSHPFIIGGDQTSGNFSYPWAGRIDEARVWNVCAPSGRLEYVLGFGQEANVAPSRLHSKVEPGSVAARPKLGFGSFDRDDGLEVIDVLGGTVSIVQPKLVVVPGLPARSWR